MPTRAFDTILVPVDFSEISANALRTASAMAARCGRGKLVAMYANWFEAPAYFTVGRLAELEAELRGSAQAAERTLASFVQSSLGDRAGAVEIRVMDGYPADAIGRMTTSANAALIVMGTHGRTGFNRWMLGSVAERVLRESPVPVLTVRGAAVEAIRDVLCPVHDTDLSRQAMRLAAAISGCFGAKLTVLHVEEPSGAGAVSDLCRWIPEEERARCVIAEAVRAGDASEQIVKLATEAACDLIVLGAPRRNFFGGMVLGTTTLRTVRHAPCPVLTVGPAVSSEQG